VEAPSKQVSQLESHVETVRQVGGFVKPSSPRQG